MSRLLRSRLVLGILAALLIVTASLTLFRGHPTRTVRADFDRTVGLFVGSDVRVMGMRVGHVESITPHGTSVRVVMSYDGQYSLPVGVKAVIVAPSVISDRFVQLTPGYVSGPVLASGAVISEADTRTPVELDQSLRTTTNLMAALGPAGANAHGALSNALATIAGVMKGTGSDARSSLRDLASFSDTLATNSPELAANVRQLSQLTSALAAHDGDVQAFNQELGAISQTLAGDSVQLSDMLTTLAKALGEVEGFVRGNRVLLVKDVNRLSAVTGALVAERKALIEIADIAPLAFQNLTETYDPVAKAVRTRANFGEVAKVLDGAVCDALIKQAGPRILPVCKQLHALFTAGGPK